jgi:dephospho-CoA kinase
MKKAVQKIRDIMLKGPTAMILVGLPGCGKSTFLSMLKEYQKIIVASTDDLIEEAAKKAGKTYSEMFDKVNHKQLKKQMDEVIRSAVNSQTHFAVDQTNMGKKKRMSLLEFVPISWQKVCVNFNVDEKVHKARLQARAEATGKIIPHFVLSNMMKSYQPPSRDEGFTSIIEVDNTNDIR